VCLRQVFFSFFHSTFVFFSITIIAPEKGEAQPDEVDVMMCKNIGPALGRMILQTEVHLTELAFRESP